jgi:hypothetical protein
VADVANTVAATSVVAGITALWLDRFSHEFFGIPISALVAAFAGAVIILLVTEPQKFMSALSRVLGSTVAAGFTTPLVAHQNEFLNSHQIGVAFFLGLFILILIKASVEVVKKLPEDLRQKWLGGGDK